MNPQSTQPTNCTDGVNCLTARALEPTQLPIQRVSSRKLTTHLCTSGAEVRNAWLCQYQVGHWDRLVLFLSPGWLDSHRN